MGYRDLALRGRFWPAEPSKQYLSVCQSGPSQWFCYSSSLCYPSSRPTHATQRACISAPGNSTQNHAKTDPNTAGYPSCEESQSQKSARVAKKLQCHCSSFNISKCPISVAHDSGVRPRLSLASGSAPSLASSSFFLIRMPFVCMSLHKYVSSVRRYFCVHVPCVAACICYSMYMSLRVYGSSLVCFFICTTLRTHVFFIYMPLYVPCWRMLLFVDVP